MENQLDNNTDTTISSNQAKGIILIVGLIFGALIAFAACGSFWSLFAGAFVGFIFAVFFTSVLYRQNPSDR